MSCSYCGKEFLICQEGDMYVCEDCYDDLDCSECTSKTWCSIYQAKKDMNRDCENESTINTEKETMQIQIDVAKELFADILASTELDECLANRVELYFKSIEY